MKATLALEYIGEAHDARLALYSRRIDQLTPGLGSALIGPSRPRRPWVAEIRGRDAKYGLQRRFLEARTSREHANGEHSRGVYLWFILESGVLYEAKAPVSWTRSERYFLTVTAEGSIQRLTNDEAELWLSTHSGLMS